jgi:hypothetical protein
MIAQLGDLLFLIGFFLLLIGGVVLGTFLLGPSDLVQGIHVNLWGGGALSFIGICMIALNSWSSRKVS